MLMRLSRVFYGTDKLNSDFIIGVASLTFLPRLSRLPRLHSFSSLLRSQTSIVMNDSGSRLSFPEGLGRGVLGRARSRFPNPSSNVQNDMDIISIHLIESKGTPRKDVDCGGIWMRSIRGAFHSFCYCCNGNFKAPCYASSRRLIMDNLVTMP